MSSPEGSPCRAAIRAPRRAHRRRRCSTVLRRACLTAPADADSDSASTTSRAPPGRPRSPASRSPRSPGIVTGVRTYGSRGFWIQDPARRTPTRPPARASSSSPAPRPTSPSGDSVQVSGTVGEYVPGGDDLRQPVASPRSSKPDGDRRLLGQRAARAADRHRAHPCPPRTPRPATRRPAAASNGAAAAPGAVRPGPLRVAGGHERPARRRPRGRRHRPVRRAVGDGEAAARTRRRAAARFTARTTRQNTGRLQVQSLTPLAAAALPHGRRRRPADRHDGRARWTTTSSAATRGGPRARHCTRRRPAARDDPRAASRRAGGRHVQRGEPRPVATTRPSSTALADGVVTQPRRRPTSSPWRRSRTTTAPRTTARSRADQTRQASSPTRSSRRAARRTSGAPSTRRTARTAASPAATSARSSSSTRSGSPSPTAPGGDATTADRGDRGRTARPR